MLRFKMFEMGHSKSEIDALGVEFLGELVGYWSGKSRGEAKLRRTQQKLSKGGKGKKKSS
jgi:hypothetical protein